MKDLAPVRVLAHIIRETERGVLIQTQSGVTTWLPKSHAYPEPGSQDGFTVMILAAWLARERGLLQSMPTTTENVQPDVDVQPDVEKMDKVISLTAFRTKKKGRA